MNNDQKIKQICDNPDVNSLSWDEPKEKPKCIICGDILQGRDDDSSTTCRWCIQGWTENEPKQIKQICDNPDVNALQISSIEDLNELPLSSETQGEEDGSINTKSRVRGGAINIDNTNNNIHDSKLEETISITDKDGKVYKFEKDRLYNHRLFYVDINNKTVFGIANCSSVYWKEDGKCYNAYDSERLEVYDLTPIKPKELTLNEILQDVQDKQMSVHASELLIKAQFKISEES